MTVTAVANLEDGLVEHENEQAKTFGEIWDTLRAINYSEYIETRVSLGGFKPSYLSWANALLLVTTAYPQFRYGFDKDEHFEDGTVMVQCSVSIDRFCRTMFLPVMTQKFEAIKNPDARDISDARMRCLAKAIACLGLGLQLYSGEDIPGDVVSNKPDVPKKPYVKKEKVDNATKEKHDTEAVAMLAMIEEETSLDELREFWTKNTDTLTLMEKNAKVTFVEVLAQFKKKAESLTKEGK